MQLIAGILTNTPLWFWLILAGLVYLGLRRTRTRETTHVGILTPAALFGLLAIGKLALGHFAAPAVLGTVAGIVAATILLFTVRPGNRARPLEDGKLLIEGEWFSLVLIIVVFSVNYAIAVLSAIQPALAAGENVRFAYGFINALSAGFMIGRAVVYLRKVQRRVQGA
jgi:hypothetical protein